MLLMCTDEHGWPWICPNNVYYAETIWHILQADGVTSQLLKDYDKTRQIAQYMAYLACLNKIITLFQEPNLILTEGCA